MLTTELFFALAEREWRLRLDHLRATFDRVLPGDVLRGDRLDPDVVARLVARPALPRPGGPHPPLVEQHDAALRDAILSDAPDRTEVARATVMRSLPVLVTRLTEPLDT